MSEPGKRPTDALLATAAWGAGTSFKESLTSSGFLLSKSTLDNINLPLVIGEYEIQKLLGAGGMGRVYVAEHRRMERTVAIKILPYESVNRPEAVNQFYQEIRAAARLLHPNIVTAFDAGQMGDLRYLVMEYVDGPTLDRLIHEQGPLSPSRAIELIIQAAIGLQYAHRAGVVHRDIKPSNMILSADGVLKLLDLGLASLQSSVESSPGSDGAILGTLEFMAPEQFLDPQNIDHRADFYALGCTLFFFLTGRCPFSGNFRELLNCHRYSPLPLLTACGIKKGEAIDALLSKMTAKAPSSRYADAAELLSALRAIASPLVTKESLHPTVALSPSPDTPGFSHAADTQKGSVIALGLDIDGAHLAGAIAEPNGNIEFSPLGKDDRPLMDFAVAERRNGQLVFGRDALARLEARPNAVFNHFLRGSAEQIATKKVGGVDCPDTCLVGTILHYVREKSLSPKVEPQLLGIAIPSALNQKERNALHSAGMIAGFPKVKLFDRNLIAVVCHAQDMQHSHTAEHQMQAQDWLVISFTEIASEVAVFRFSAGHLQMTSILGNRSLSISQWQKLCCPKACRAFST